MANDYSISDMVEKIGLWLLGLKEACTAFLKISIFIFLRTVMLREYFQYLKSFPCYSHVFS